MHSSYYLYHLWLLLTLICWQTNWKKLVKREKKKRKSGRKKKNLPGLLTSCWRVPLISGCWTKESFGCLCWFIFFFWERICMGRRGIQLVVVNPTLLYSFLFCIYFSERNEQKAIVKSTQEKWCYNRLIIIVPSKILNCEQCRRFNCH